MLNLQMFYLILGNFAFLEIIFHRVPTPPKGFIFYFFLFLFLVLIFLFFQNHRLYRKLLFICAFFLVMSPCICWKVMVCLPIGLCLLILS